MSHQVQKGDICWPPVLISSMPDGEPPPPPATLLFHSLFAWCGSQQPGRRPTRAEEWAIWT